MAYDGHQQIRLLKQAISKRVGLPFGCLFVALLGPAMGFVVFLGITLGDCAQGDPCHRNDAISLIHDASIVAPIVAVGGGIVWLVSSLFIRAVGGRLPRVAISTILSLFSALAAWFAFDPAFALYFKILGVE
ncbi:MAG: hypothetical protein ACKOPG_08895 [Novosphingobium sp.]